MSEWIKGTHPDLGLDFETKPVRVINRTAATHQRGHVMQFDTFRTAPETTNAKFGSENSCWVNVVDPDFQAAGGKGGQSFALVCALLGPCAPGQSALAVLWGLEVQVLATLDQVVAGDAGAINSNLSNALEFSSGVAGLNAASKIVAIAQASHATGDVLIPCLFNGFHSWGKV